MHIILFKPLKGGNNNSKEVTICITCKFPVRLVVLKMGFGEYPPEFNPRIHGPYHPGRYYGKGNGTFLGLLNLLLWYCAFCSHDFRSGFFDITDMNVTLDWTGLSDVTKLLLLC